MKVGQLNFFLSNFSVSKILDDSRFLKVRIIVCIVLVLCYIDLSSCVSPSQIYGKLATCYSSMSISGLKICWIVCITCMFVADCIDDIPFLVSPLLSDIGQEDH